MWQTQELSLNEKVCFELVFSDVRQSRTYRVAQKSKPPPSFQKIVLKIANEIRFLRKVKV